jgi:hypothetical protein
MREAIRRLPAPRDTRKYHETMTLNLGPPRGRGAPAPPDELELAEIPPANPHLLDKSTPFAY